ncbi:hypothetical protein IJJ39_02575 [Candidatus Saccharibacteria bacterium]|nr:hypothetical protein [Candidatus Saccharibacteria bacterium]
MYHKVRAIVASLVIITICILSSSGTLSYFTDTDSMTSNFIVGNASTSLAVYDDVTGDEYHLLDVSNYEPLVENTEVPFILESTNDGNIPVYHRFRVVIPSALASVTTIVFSDMDACVVEDSTTDHTCSNDNYVVSYTPPTDTSDAEYSIVSKHAISVGESVSKWGWPTEKIVFGDLAGIDTSVYTCEQDDANNCTFGIGIYSDSIQTTGFADAEAAFAD